MPLVGLSGGARQNYCSNPSPPAPVFRRVESRRSSLPFSPVHLFSLPLVVGFSFGAILAVCARVCYAQYGRILIG